MAAKFMRIRKIVIPFFTLLILVTQLSGCVPKMSHNEIAEESKNNTEVVIEVADQVVSPGDLPEEYLGGLEQNESFDVSFFDGVSESIGQPENDSSVEDVNSGGMSIEQIYGYFESAYSAISKNEHSLYSIEFVEDRIALEIAELQKSLPDIDESVYRKWRLENRPTELYNIKWNNTPDGTTAVAVAGVDVYKNPCKLDSEWAYMLVSDTTLKVLKVSEMNLWASVEISGSILTIPYDDLEFSTEEIIENDGVVTEDPLFDTVDKTMYTTSQVNIRSSWSSKSEKLGTLSRGTEINVIGIGKSDTEASDWVRIKMNIDNDEDPEEVYLHKSYISDTKPSSGGSGSGSGSSGSSTGSGNSSTGSSSGGSSGNNNSTSDNESQEDSGSLILKPAEPGGGGGSTEHNDVSGGSSGSYEEDTSHITPENGYGMG